MGLVIAGERSGVGKTTVTLALLAGLRRWGHRVQAFKVGPDYIDPMFHTRVTDRPSYNLDIVLTATAYVRQCVATHCQDVDFAVVEGVMGLFDGASPAIQSTRAAEIDPAAPLADLGSTAHIARVLGWPVLLVVDCARLSTSIAALVHGYQSIDPQVRLAGIVLNRVGSDRHRDLLTAALAPLGIPIVGVLHRDDTLIIPDRHLGLVPTAELPELDTLLQQLADQSVQWFDWSALWPLLTVNAPPVAPVSVNPVGPARIAIAQDAAFSFYYAENLNLLTQLGAELVPWSPRTEPLPAELQGLILGGGFPEMFAEELAAQTETLTQVRQAIQAGLPTYAECGGLMYLSQALTDFAGQTWPMVGALPTQAVMGKRLTLGYRHAIAQAHTPLVRPGQHLWGHEFHRSHLTVPPAAPLFQFSDRAEGWWQPPIQASYLHLHWGATPELPQRFLQACVAPSASRHYSASNDSPQQSTR